MVAISMLSLLAGKYDEINVASYSLSYALSYSLSYSSKEPWKVGCVPLVLPLYTKPNGRDGTDTVNNLTDFGSRIKHFHMQKLAVNFQQISVNELVWISVRTSF